MSDENAGPPPTPESPKPREQPLWLQATLDDLNAVDLEAPIAGATTARCSELSNQFQAALSPQPQEGAELPATAETRVYQMIGAVAGMYFRPEQRNEPFGPLMILADGRRTAAPEDFRGGPLEVLAAAAERATNPVLRARLGDVCWLLERRRGTLGSSAIAAYVEIVRKVASGELKLADDEEPGALKSKARDYLRRALQIGRGIGWDKAETRAARELAIELRKAANAAGVLIPIYWFSELDLDFELSDPADVGTDLDMILQSLPAETDTHTKVDLWKLAARAYHDAKKTDDATRCQFEAAECLVAEAEALSTRSAMLASHSLSQAIAELHGLPGKRERRKELQHRLVDIQAGIPDEMNIFERTVDMRDIAEQVKTAVSKPSLVEKLFAFTHLAQSPEPDALSEKAAKSIREHPLASVFGASHHDSEGKVIHRTEGGGFGEGGHSPAVEQQISQHETIRRELVAFEVDVARRLINENHYISDDVFFRVLQYSFVVPSDLKRTFAHGFERFFRGDCVSATYILTPLLENSLRHVLKANGHDVSIFDDATQTQQDRTISSLFEQMRPELEAIFTKPIIADIENTFLKKPGPHLRHQVAHGLLHDGDPYGRDAQYGCWLIMRLCLLPIFRQTEQLIKVLEPF